MSKRAEQKARRAYADHEGFTFEDERKAYAKGYEQAEKDTIERAVDWLKYAQDKKMSFDGAIAYFKAIMEEEK